MNQILNTIRSQAKAGEVKISTVIRALKHNKKHSMWVMIASQADLDAYKIVEGIAARLQITV